MNWQRTDFKKYLAQTSPDPMMFEPHRAEGVYFYDQNGKPFIDLISGISVNGLGHNHPAVVEAVQNQVSKYMHSMVYGEFVLSPQVVLAKWVMKTLPDPLDKIYLVNSGSEAVEGAIKLAFKSSGRKGLISCKNAYHGSTTGALSLMSDKYYSSGYKPLLPQVDFIEFNNTKSLKKIDEQIAAVFVEPVQGEAGYLPAEEEFISALRKKCDETGALLVFDEIQSGMGRTGEFWAMNHWGVVPDVLLTAKGFGGGLPLGAFISSGKLMESLSDQPILGHITTFGGNPVSCAASIATFKELLQSELINNVDEKEALFRSEFKQMGFDELSGKGLMLGLPTGDFETSKRMVEKCLRSGLIIDWFLYDTSKLRIAPPLVISLEQIVESCKIIGEAWKEIH